MESFQESTFPYDVTGENENLYFCKSKYYRQVCIAGFQQKELAKNSVLALCKIQYLSRRKVSLSLLSFQESLSYYRDSSMAVTLIYQIFWTVTLNLYKGRQVQQEHIGIILKKRFFNSTKDFCILRKRCPVGTITNSYPLFLIGRYTYSLLISANILTHKE